MQRNQRPGAGILRNAHEPSRNPAVMSGDIWPVEEDWSKDAGKRLWSKPADDEPEMFIEDGEASGYICRKRACSSGLCS